MASSSRSRAPASATPSPAPGSMPCSTPPLGSQSSTAPSARRWASSPGRAERAAAWTARCWGGAGNDAPSPESRRGCAQTTRGGAALVSSLGELGLGVLAEAEDQLLALGLGRDLDLLAEAHDG